MVADRRPDRVVVHGRPPADAAVVPGESAVNLVEALSVRRPLTGDGPADHRWLVDTLAMVFEAD